MSRAYDEYLRSPEWAVMRRIALSHAGHRCQVCNRTGILDVHHRTYDRIGRELLSDVTVLCRDCHAQFHGKTEQPEPAPVEVVPQDGPPLLISAAESALQDRIAAECFDLPVDLEAAA